MKVAYFTSIYPAVSHTFIRREIIALEELGLSIGRYALRPGDGLVDAIDLVERKKTRYILRTSVLEVVRCCITAILLRPVVAIRALLCAIKLGRRSDSGFLRHFAYLAEAFVLADWCTRDGMQHLHAHFGTNPAAVALLTSIISGIPYSFTAHGSGEFERAPLMSLGLKLRHAAFAVCVSSFGRSQLMRWSSPDCWHKISVIRCGVDPVYLAAPVNSPPNCRRFVCVGRLSEEKGQLVLLAAARRLHQAGVEVQIVLAGDGPMRSIIEGTIRRAGLQNQVTITGWVTGEQVRTEIVAARALIVPSFMENLPVVIMEAMALGRPVISSQVAGIPELVEPKTTGWLVPAGDAIALSAAIKEALEAPSEQLSSMGSAGRSRVIRDHDVLTEARRLRDMFDGYRTVSQYVASTKIDLGPLIQEKESDNSVA